MTGVDSGPGEGPIPAPAARLFALAAAYAGGVLLAEAVEATWWVPALACAVALVWTAARRTTAALLIAGLALGLALAGMRLASVREAALAEGAGRGADALLEGEVLSTPETAGGALRFLLGVRHAEIDGVPVRLRERAWVSVRPPPRRAPEPGDLVRVDARLGPLLRDARAADAAPRAAAAHLRREGVAARAYALSDGLERIGRSHNPLVAVARAGRSAVARAARTLPERERGLLLGVTIGDTSALDPALALDFRATGLTHLLAVSGANLALFLGAVGLLLRAVRAGRRTTVAVLACGLLGFMAITRFEPSVLRAGAMAGIGLAGIAAGARREATVALAVAALGLLVLDPFLVHSIGFQLSALATLGILALAPRLAAVLPAGPIGAAAAVTLGAQLTVAPLIALHFHQVSLVALLANLLAMPAIAPATVLGLACAAAGVLWAPLAASAVVTWPALAWMAWVARVLARVPLASVGTPGGALGLLVAAAMTLLALGATRARRPRRLAPLVLGLALLVTGTTWARALAPPPPAGLVLTALDVGQGDAFLVRAPGGATMLVDGGPDVPLLLRKLRAAHVGRIDLLVLTHPHADHVIGLAEVAARHAIGRALDPWLEDDLPAYRRYIDVLARRGIPRDRARAGLAYHLGPALVEVLGPSEIVSGTDSDLNNNSAVLTVRFGIDSLLLSGEVQEDGQDALLMRRDRLRARVMTVPHHGSPRMLPEFFAAAGAAVAVVSVGPNTFGHPSPATLAALRLAGTRVLRTDESGDVTVALDGRGALDVRTAK